MMIRCPNTMLSTHLSSGNKYPPIVDEPWIYTSFFFQIFQNFLCFVEYLNVRVVGPRRE